MRLYSYSSDSLEGLKRFAEEHGISKEDILSTTKSDGIYTMEYYAE